MARFKGKFDSIKNDWETPDDLFQTVNQEFGFTLDVAASPHNAKLARFITKEQDSMQTSWGTEVCWLNPPYGEGYKLAEWVKKAHRESTLGATVVMLIPARTNTRWFHDFCLKYGEVRFIKGRPKFGDAEHGLPQPLCFVIFRPVGNPAIGVGMNYERPSSINLLSLFE